MLQSMTGYGKATGLFAQKKITIEIRSLNSKGIDVYLKTPLKYRAYEIPIRKQIQASLLRGKIECLITEELIHPEDGIAMNEALIYAYYQKMLKIADELDGDKVGLLPAILRIPDVFRIKEEEIKEEEWEEIQDILTEAIQNLSAYRTTEGASTILDFNDSINGIEELLKRVELYEDVRIQAVRSRMSNALATLNENIDDNRFEQELIYYLEKIDINEEKKRLQQHIDYFRDTMTSEGTIGKKLGFISQEMGREINTLGSKSYHADLQKLVVTMKDYLEKIKEQVLNTL